MGLELIAQVDPNGEAFKAGQLVGIVIATIISATIPVAFGASRGQLALGIGGAICAIPAAILFGCLGGLPIALLFVGIISVAGGDNRTRKRKKRHRYDDDDDEYDDRRRRSRRRDDDEDDFEDDEPPRRSRRRDEDDDEDDTPRRRRRSDD